MCRSPERVARFLDDLMLRVSLPEEIILDNGPEGTSKAMFNWSEWTDVRLRFIEPGKPVQNSFVESCNGKFRDECLNLYWFRSLCHAREEIGRWRNHHNTKRPHSALGYLSPMDFPMNTTAAALENSRSLQRWRSTLEPNRKNPDQTGPNGAGRSIDLNDCKL